MTDLADHVIPSPLGERHAIFVWDRQRHLQLAFSYENFNHVTCPIAWLLPEVRARAKELSHVMGGIIAKLTDVK